MDEVGKTMRRSSGTENDNLRMGKGELRSEERQERRAEGTDRQTDML